MNETNLPMLSEKIRKKDKYFPAHIVQQLYQTIDNTRDLAYMMFSIETGLRVADVVHAEWVHLDYQLSRLYVFDHKKDEWRYIYFPEKVKATLNQWRKQLQIEEVKDKRIFPFTERTGHRIVRHWLKAIEFRYWNQTGPHWMRHTFIRLSRDAGRDLKLVQVNTGDSVRTILEWYESLDDSRARREIEKPLTG